MKIFALLAEGYTEAVGYQNSKEVDWKKLTFTQNPEIMNALEPKCIDFPITFAPTTIQAMADMLKGNQVPFRVVHLELTEKEAITLSKKHNQLTLA